MAIERKQLAVAAAFHDFALFHDQNAIRILDSGKTVRKLPIVVFAASLIQDTGL